MQIKEFVERTGFEPTFEEYGRIEKAYMEFDGDKDAFCKAFVEAGGEHSMYVARALQIANQQSQIIDLQKALQQRSKEYENKIAKLQAELDAELEWQPCHNIGTSLPQPEYEKLANQPDTKIFSLEEAIDFISRKCGFDPAKITITNTVKTYEINKHHRTRVAQAFIRESLYNATDWNYICFSCAGYEYEYIDGQLFFYDC